MASRSSKHATQHSTQRTQLRRPAVAAPQPSDAQGSTSYGSAERPKVQLMLNRYSVLEVRTSGGFGQVAICWDTRLQRRVAIKCIPLVAFDEEIPTTSPADAMSEARIACMLAHPNIVTVYDFESDGTWAYIVMEYVDGLSLAELMQRVEGGTLTCEEAAYVLQSVASALSFAHDNGVLHLDIKPSNILIDRSGAIKLSDFGMAALTSAAGWGGARGGTIGYMPAEQISGELVDERCDVFALAALMWEVLSGRAPFTAASAEASLSKIRKGPTPRISKFDARLAGPVEDTLLRALSFAAVDRTSNVADFAYEMVSALGDVQEGARSIQMLLGQLYDDEIETRPAQTYIPLALRAPWLEMACIRGLSMFVCALVAYKFLGPITSCLIGGGKIMAILLCALAGALWPPAGSAAALIGLSGSVGLISQDPTTTSFRLAVAFVLLCASALWWWTNSRKNYLATLGLLTGVATGTMSASVCISALFAQPLSAFITAGAARALLGVWPAWASVSYEWTAMLQATAELCASAPFWIEVVGCGLAAAVGALCTARSTATAVVGQVLAGAILVATEMGAAMVENAGIWHTPDPMFVALTLGWIILLSIFLVVFGPTNQSIEVI